MDFGVMEKSLSKDGRVAAKDAGYMELDGAEKGSDCRKVYVKGGVSSDLGCCNLFDPKPKTQTFSCGTCRYVR